MPIPARAPSVHRPVRPGRVGPSRSVPAGVARPPYLATDGVPLDRALRPKTAAADVARMRAAGAAARRVLEHVCAAVAPGVTTDELDAVAHDACLAEGGYPSPLGYRGFPKSVCTSVQDVVAHGIPDDRALGLGEIVNCDVTLYLDGVHGDCSRTVVAGGWDAAPTDVQALVAATEEALAAGIAVAGPGVRVREVGRAVARVADAHGFGVVRELVGHGIGEAFHGDPNVHHYDEPRNRCVLRPGLAFTIEPMLTLGLPDVIGHDDGWTISTFDGLPSAQFEHTLLVTADDVEVLTALAGDHRYPLA